MGEGRVESGGAGRATGRRLAWGELMLAVAVVLFGALVLWQTTEIRLTPAYSTVGPRVIPFIVGGGLVLIGLWLAVEVVSGRAAAPSGESEDADPTLATDWATVGMLAAALIAYLVLIEPVGFVLATGVLYAGAAYAMGSRRPLRDAATGLILGVVLFLVFTRGLGLSLPGGVLAGLGLP